MKKGADSVVGLVSDMCVDLVMSGNVRPSFGQVEQLVSDYELEIGGSGNIFACQMAKLGYETAVIGRVGQDLFGRHLLHRLKEEGVDVSRVAFQADLKTGIGLSLVEFSDRAILTYLGSIGAVTAEDLPITPADFCTHWHTASYYLLTQLQSVWPDYFANARAQRVTLSLDPNWDPSEQWKGIDALLGLIDVFMPNEAEVLAIARESDVLSAARRLSSFGPIVVVKRGANGSLAVTDDRVYEMPLRTSDALLDVIDSVGAGDNFDAGFLSGWLKGDEIDECLRRGHYCAASSLRFCGAIRGQLTGRELLALLIGTRSNS